MIVDELFYGTTALQIEEFYFIEPPPLYCIVYYRINAKSRIKLISYDHSDWAHTWSAQKRIHSSISLLTNILTTYSDERFRIPFRPQHVILYRFRLKISFNFGHCLSQMLHLKSKCSVHRCVAVKTAGTVLSFGTI